MRTLSLLLVTETRLAMLTDGTRYVDLLDGVAGETVYTHTVNTSAEMDLDAWRALALRPGGRPFWIGTVDCATSCTNIAAAQSIYARSRAHGDSPYVTTNSVTQVCYWPF